LANKFSSPLNYGSCNRSLQYKPKISLNSENISCPGQELMYENIRRQLAIFIHIGSGVMKTTVSAVDVIAE